MEKLNIIFLCVSLSILVWVVISKDSQSTKELVFAAYELGWKKGTTTVIYTVDNTNEWTDSISKIEFKKDSVFLINALDHLP